MSHVARAVRTHSLAGLSYPPTLYTNVYEKHARALGAHFKRNQSDKQVRAEGAPEFPGKRVVTEESFLGDRSDANSEFVRHRKEQLSSFLRQLFNRNPGEPEVR